MHNHNQIMAEDELPSIDETPWLLAGLLENKDDAKLDQKQTFFTINDNNSTVKKIVELQGKSIIASVMGWFILRDLENSTIYTLWNPITRNSILLPELLDSPAETEHVTCIFTSPPNYYEDGFDTAKCVLLLFCKGLVFFCRPMNEDCKWVKQRLEHDSDIVRISQGVTLNDGVIYAYANLFNDNEEDGSFHTVFARLKVGLNSVGFEVLSLKCPLSKIVYKMFTREISYLVEVCGDLYAVNVIPRQLDLENVKGYDIVRAFVWKLDLSKMEWIQVESLGDRAFLVGHSCSTWCWADTCRGRIEGDCIYEVSTGSDTIHQYRLQDNSYTFLPSHANFRNSSYGPIWFMPHDRTRLTSLEKTIVEKIQDIHLVEKTKYVEELEVMNREIPTSLLLELPLDVVTSIADRMHWFDCMNFRATCKKMHSEISKPKWKANSSLPLFMFLKNSEGICELWDPIYQNNGTITKKLPYLPSIVSTVEFCKDDWLLLRSHEGCYLQYLNLFTGEKGEYPTESLAPGLSSFVLSTSPISPDCVTAGIGSMGYVDVSVLQAGHVEWETFQIDMQGAVGFQANNNSSPKYHNGAFYFLDESGNLAVLKLIDEGFGWSIFKGPLQENDSRSRNLSECYIAELDGQLIYVFIQDLGSKVQVYKFDMNKKLWVEVKCLGDFMLFVSSASSFSVAAKESSMRNRIYLPKRIGNEMVFYSLDTGKYHTSSSKDTYEKFHGMISQPFSCWV
ncbi:uncharacterized protein LOC141622634 [Silene latifolia]|uniref:uncharacterized protein LOC141622634 n=1 Tax=Silene latifolia TaxID=37657 RepID=UPI003D7823B6